MFCKGAPDMLFDRCNQILLPSENDGSSQILPIEDETAVLEDLLTMEEADDTNDSYRGILDRIVHNFANQAYRTILISYKDMSMDDYEQFKAENNDFETD